MTDIDTTQYSLEDLVHEKQYRMCFPKSDDPEVLLDGFVYFCTTFWHIRHPSRGRIKFDLFEAQLETVDSWLNVRYSLILKARQVGFSTLVAAFAYWTAQYDDRAILMLSRTEREAIKLLQKAKYGHKFLPEWLRFRLGPVNTTQTKMEFPNNSYIESLPSASDPARGESAYLIVVDEMAFLNNSDEAWSAIEPVADVGGRVIMFSTANGEGNLFHKLWVGATAGVNRFTPLFFPWSSNGRDQDWYDAKASDLPEWQMAQEYPDNPEDAFLKSGRPVFNLQVLRDIETHGPQERGFIDRNGNFISDGGPLRIWKQPDKNGRYVIGADVAQGLEHGDYSSAHVINARNHEVVAIWHGHTDPDLFGSEVLYRLGRYYNKALVGVESNQHGLTTLKYLAQQKYHPIYYERSPKYKRSVPTDVLGFSTTQVSKPLVIDSLREAIRDSMKIWDEETIAELRTFVRDEKGKTSGSPFDDRVMSLAIANHMLKFVWHSEFQPEKEIIPGSVADWEMRTFGETFSEVTSGNSKKWSDGRKPIGTFAVRHRT